LFLQSLPLRRTAFKDTPDALQGRLGQIVDLTSAAPQKHANWLIRKSTARQTATNIDELTV
jgi:hypothetical protein